jgi:ABC-2 type transport system ATP-binding protein
MTDTAPAIEIRGLRKAYGAVEAVRGIDLSVAAGECFALLGPNGAGKTTTVEILEGYRSRDAGEVRVFGRDPADNETELKERIGIVLQESGVQPYLTVREVVTMFAGYYPRPRDVDEVIALVDLVDAADQRISRLSGGQGRRVDLALGLIGDPDLLFLDEPTSGFDPSARRQAWASLRALIGLGKTVLLTTHFMDEAQALADHVAVIARGEIVARGRPDTLGGRETHATVVRFGVPDGARPPEALGARVTASGAWQIESDEPTRTLHDLTGWAVDQGFELVGLEVSRPTLEDVYLSLTGDGKDDAS